MGAVSVVVEAGFAEPEIEEVPFRWRFADQDAYWRFLIDTAASVSPVLRALSSEALNTVRERVHEAVRPFHSICIHAPVICRRIDPSNSSISAMFSHAAILPARKVLLGILKQKAASRRPLVASTR